MPRSTWDKPAILQALRGLHRSGKELSYNRLARSKQALVSAAAYHFGSYRQAIEKAGIDYAGVARRPRWTKPLIIQLIKEARRKGQDLHWSAVNRRRDELGRAAFASLQPRLFGSWDRALHGAGLDADEISRYRKWTAETLVFELRARHRDGEPLNSGALQKEDPGLHAAAVRHFGGYDAALRAAKLDPAKLRRRRHWTKAEVIAELRRFRRRRHSLADGLLRVEAPALYGAALRLFKTLKAARAAAEKKEGKAGEGKR